MRSNCVTIIILYHTAPSTKSGIVQPSLIKKRNRIILSQFGHFGLCICQQTRLAKLDKWVQVSLGAPFIQPCATSMQKKPRIWRYNHNLMYTTRCVSKVQQVEKYKCRKYQNDNKDIYIYIYIYMQILRLMLIQLYKLFYSIWTGNKILIIEYFLIIFN